MRVGHGLRGLVVRTARERDLPLADAVLREAFDAFTGREGHFGDGDPLTSRWRTDRRRVFVAELEGEIVGSNAITARGSLGWFGPLAVAPTLWGSGVAHPLIDEAHERLTGCGADEVGLFTFADSPLHLSLYSRHGYWPGPLMLIMARDVRGARAGESSQFADLPVAEREGVLRELRALTDRVHAGWDLTRDVVSTSEHGLGGTVLVHDAGGLAGAALCHLGPGSEAQSGTCRVKTAVARPGPSVEARMARLLDAVAGYATKRGAGHVIAVVSAASEACARLLLEQGHRVAAQGVAMHRGGLSHHREGVWVLDDWR